MDSKLDKLRQLRLTTEKIESPLSIEIKNLLNEQYLRGYIETLSRHIKASNAKVTASQFIKRYAFLPVIYMYAMTAWNEKLNISYENVSLESKDSEEIWLPNFRLHSLVTENSLPDRENWRTNSIEALFKEHISPILDILSRTTKVSKSILWENIAVYIFWLYETVLMEKEVPEYIKSRSKEDFQFIIFHAAGNLFGEYSVNPFTRYYKEKEEVVRKRSTCCYSHLTNSKKYCSTCPSACK